MKFAFDVAVTVAARTYERARQMGLGPAEAFELAEVAAAAVLPGDWSATMREREARIAVDRGKRTLHVG